MTACRLHSTPGSKRNLFLLKSVLLVLGHTHLVSLPLLASASPAGVLGFHLADASQKNHSVMSSRTPQHGLFGSVNIGGKSLRCIVRGILASANSCADMGRCRCGCGCCCTVNASRHGVSQDENFDYTTPGHLLSSDRGRVHTVFPFSLLQLPAP